jgi:hypothetical protein
MFCSNGMVLLFIKSQSCRQVRFYEVYTNVSFLRIIYPFLRPFSTSTVKQVIYFICLNFKILTERKKMMLLWYSCGGCRCLN